MLREVPFGADGDFSEKSLLGRYNAELANNLGNLLQRTVTLITKNFGGLVPTAPAPVRLLSDLADITDRIDAAYNALAFHECVGNRFHADDSHQQIHRRSGAVETNARSKRTTLDHFVGMFFGPQSFGGVPFSIYAWKNGMAEMWGKLGERTSLTDIAPKLIESFRKGRDSAVVSKSNSDQRRSAFYAQGRSLEIIPKEKSTMKKTKNILVVDDEDSVLAAMKDLLESKGYTVLEANNGVTGLKLLTEKAVDGVVLSTSTCPRMDGYMFMEHLKNRWATEGMGRPFPKVLVLTAVDKGTDLGLARNFGRRRFHEQAFSKSSEFIEAVKKLVQKLILFLILHLLFILTLSSFYHTLPIHTGHGTTKTCAVCGHRFFKTGR